MRRFAATALCLTAIVSAAALAAIIAGCSTAAPAASLGPSAPVVPPAADLSSPESAVRSYLDWSSLAYRMANSEAASLTCTPGWGVHVDAYIQLNRENGAKAIDQRLTLFEKRSESSEGTSAVLAAYEEWDYRYFSLDGQKWVSTPYRASYDTTYTLVYEGGKWLVDDVAADPLTELQ